MNGSPASLPLNGEGENLALYAGRWVALVGEQVVGQGGTPGQARRAAKATRPKEKPRVVYVPVSMNLISSRVIDQVLEAIPSQVPLFLVGGAVRDALLSRSLHDYDFAMPGNVLQYARMVANQLGGAYFPLDQERDTARVILSDLSGLRMTLDFAAYRGPDLESDLRGRDFTINAMAVDLRHEKTLLDPLGGAADLRAKRLRACSPTSLVDDPLRILRGIRIAAALDLHILRDTRVLMRAAVSALLCVTPERVRDELFNILSGPQPHTCIRALDMLGATQHVLPELLSLQGVEQSPPHFENVWEHTLGVVQELGSLLQALDMHYDEDISANMVMGLAVMHLGRYRQEIHQHFRTALNVDRPMRSLLVLAALYHDIGKPACQTIDEHDRIRFFKHDQIGAGIAAERGKCLRLSNLEIERLSIIIRHHLRPVLLAQGDQPVSRRAIYRFFKDTGSAGVDVCLLSLADVLATYGPTITSEHWTRHLEVVRLLLQSWWENPQESVSPPPLIDGNELIEELKIQPGPLVGQLLETIREHQAMGKIKARDEALSLAMEILENLEGT